MITACSTCGSTPTLYIANGRQFCKAHKADAEALARKSGYSTSDHSVEDFHRDARNWTKTHKRDHPIGVRAR